MARIALTDTERLAVQEALADTRQLREQVAEAVAAGLQPQSDLERLDTEIQRAEALLRIYSS